MYSEDRKILGKVILEALTERYEEELKQCKGNVSCSDEHLKRMSEILGFDVCKEKTKKKSFRKLWAAILVAAALLLMGCTAYAYREEIKGFIIEKYDKFIKVNFDVDLDEVPKSIEVEYTLGYVPEGFEQVETNSDFAFNYQKWSNSEGGRIIFYQTLLTESNGVNFDAERGEMTVVEIGGYSVYFKDTDFDNYYLWNDDNYEILLIVSVDFSREELTKIIENIMP